MGSGRDKKAWAMIFTVAMLFSTLGGLSSIAGAPAKLTSDNRNYFDSALPEITNTGFEEAIQFEYIDKDISLAAMWNDWILMSFPNKIAGHPFAVIIDGLDNGGGLVEWDIIRGWDAQNQTWMTSAKFWPPSLNTFNYVDNTMGFWLHISNYGDGALTIVGNLPQSGELITIQLYAGWNLVGYPCMASQSIQSVIGNILYYVSATEVYDRTDPYGTRYQNPWDPSYYVNPGKAIWIYMTSDEIWMFTCP